MLAKRGDNSSFQNLMSSTGSIISLRFSSATKLCLGIGEGLRMLNPELNFHEQILCVIPWRDEYNGLTIFLDLADSQISKTV